VRPGDRLTLRATVQEARVSRSDPTRGILKTNVQLLNQAGDLVLRMTAVNLVRTRPADHGR
jgi:acyl dehydratase